MWLILVNYYYLFGFCLYTELGLNISSLLNLQQSFILTELFPYPKYSLQVALKFVQKYSTYMKSVGLVSYFPTFCD